MSEKVDFTTNDFNYEGSELEIKVRTKPVPNLPPDGMIVDIKGDLNLYSTPSLKTILNNLVDKGKIKIYINTELLTYVDSSGLGAFLSIQSRLMKMNGFVKICAPSKQVLAVLELTKLKAMLKVNQTIEDGLKS
jgi:anti-sigma B factor antagonist